jgi:hypothetical protein
VQQRSQSATFAPVRCGNSGFIAQKSKKSDKICALRINVPDFHGLNQPV